MIGAALSAGANLIGGMINSSNVRDANRANAEAAQRNIKLQKTFAQEGIQWKVEDARKAGIHPLYALGAQTNSFSPVSVGQVADTSLGSAIASSGQDLSRAINATRTAPQREAAISKTMQDLQLTNMGLQNELVAAQIAKLKSSINPPMPTLGSDGVLPEGKLDDVTPLVAAGQKIQQNRGWSDGQTFEDRWGEWGGGAAGLAVLAADLLKHSAHMRAALQRKYPIDFSARGSFRENSHLIGRR